MKQGLAITLCGLSTLLAMSPHSSWAQEITLQLLPASTALRAPDAPIVLRIPGLDSAWERRFGVELDNIDIKALLQRQGERLVYQPLPGLSWGEHQLRLVEYTDDGDILERGNWTLVIHKTAALRELEMQAAFEVNSSRRIADNNLDALPDRTQTNGTLQLSGRMANKGWQVNGNVDIIGNSQEVQSDTQSGKHYDIGSYLINAKTGPASANIGHHSITPDSLILQDFHRRGVSVGWQTRGLPASLTGFALRTEPISGFRYGLGISDSQHRVSGATASLRPLTKRPNALIVNATYLEGEGAPQSGVAVAGDDTLASGEAANLALDSKLLDQRLRLRGEVAQSDYDFDGTDGSLESERDKAHAVLLTYAPWQDLMIKDQPMSVSLGLENKRIGPFFQSLANPTIVPDRDLMRGFAEFKWSGLDIQTSLGREQDNVDGIENLGQIQTDRITLMASYSPLQHYNKENKEDTSNWLGQQSYTLTLDRAKQTVEELGTGLTETGDFNRIQILNINAAFAYDIWDWGLSYTLGASEDYSDNAPDTRTHDIQLGAYFRLGKNRALTLAPIVQWNVIEDDNIPFEATTTRTTRTVTASLHTGYKFNEDVSASLGLNMNHSQASDDIIDTRTTGVNANITWHVWRAKGQRLGLAWWLNGESQDIEDAINASASVEDSYQVFLGASISWMPSY